MFVFSSSSDNLQKYSSILLVHPLSMLKTKLFSNYFFIYAIFDFIYATASQSSANLEHLQCGISIYNALTSVKPDEFQPYCMGK